MSDSDPISLLERVKLPHIDCGCFGSSRSVGKVAAEFGDKISPPYEWGGDGSVPVVLSGGITKDGDYSYGGDVILMTCKGRFKTSRDVYSRLTVDTFWSQYVFAQRRCPIVDRDPDIIRQLATSVLSLELHLMERLTDAYIYGIVKEILTYEPLQIFHNKGEHRLELPYPSRQTLVVACSTAVPGYSRK
uniref:Uncharacterized protein n=1 Tax=Spongospora subterranea TaxID=70186 RepID=A0A0H5RDB4_9EUKA|eukprot:CRZ11988.1 hypothetical protein [Spongospora subterranea]